jgi:hypothetical protein
LRGQTLSCSALGASDKMAWLLAFLAAASLAATSPPRQVDCSGVQRSVTAEQTDLFRIAFGGFQETAKRFQGRDFLNFEALIAFGNNAVDVAQLLYLLRTIESLVDSSDVSVSSLWSTAHGVFVSAAREHESRYALLPPQLQSREALQIAGLYTYATRFASDHFSRDSVDAAKRAQAWLERSLASKCVSATVGDNLSALWCPQVGQHAVIVNTGFDGSLFTLWAESGVAAYEAGYSVLVLMGPGQGET